MRIRAANGNSDRKGFALLIVIWGLGAITFLVLSFLTTGRLRLQSAFNIAGGAQAESIAAAAADAALLSLAAEGARAGPAAPPPHTGAPFFCAMEDAVVAVAIEDESGKIDLNAASEDLLQAALIAMAGMAPVQAEAAARAISEFRAPRESDLPPPKTFSDKPFPPKNAAFQTALEMDQVQGLDAAAFHALLPFVTVHSRMAGLDPHVAPPALLAALVGFSRENVAALEMTPFPNNLNRDDPRFPSAFRQTGAHKAFLIHAESVLSNGPTGVWETIVEMQSSDGAPFSVREIRRGAARYLDALRRMRDAAADLPAC